MAEEIIKNEGSEEPNYLEQALETNKSLKEQLQATREEMARMAQDNKVIMKQLLEGGSIQEEEQDTRSIEDVIKHMRDENITDLEYAKDALAYRNKCLNLKEKPFDPFVGRGHNYQEYEKEQERAENLANVLEHCIEYADGDNQVFINELNRLTVDIPGGKALNNRR